MIKPIWWPTSVAANKLGIRKSDLLSMRNLFTSGVHFRPADVDDGLSWNLDAVRQQLRIKQAN